jgi:acetylornithine/succinyldiaminopimelate/putrescine aminotransferase
VIRIGPALVISEAEVAEGLEKIGAACDAVA